MNKEQYKKLTTIDSNKIIDAYDLTNMEDRTLLYGYTCERNTWHVYLQKNRIYTVIYKWNEEPEEWEITHNCQYIPDKRLYPECCDYEFCKLLKEKGFSLPFTIWDDDNKRENTIYYGKTL